MTKRVGVSISADTSGFDNPIEGMAAKTRRSADQIKASATQAIGSITSLSAASSRLARAQSTVADASGAVRIAEQRLEAVRRRSRTSAVQHAAAEESLAKAQRKLVLSQQELTAAQEAGGKVSLGKRIDSTEVQSLGRNMALAGVAIGAGVAVAVKASADFETAMSGVASTGDYTAGQLDLLRESAIEQGKATKFSASEAAAGEAELVKAGLSVQQVLGGGLAGALNLAAAGNLSVADSASAAATAINQFGLQGSDATHVADRFVQIAGVAQGETSDVAEAFKNGAVTAKQYGLSVDDASVVLAAFAKNGIVGAQAGTLLKSSLTNLYAPTGQVQKALDKLGVSAYDAAGNALPVAKVADQLNEKLAGLDEQAKNKALARIFGKETLQGGAILAAQGARGLAAIRSELDKFPTAASTAATKMDNLNGDIEQLTGSLETGLIQSGSGANAFLRGLAQGATDAVNRFTDLPPAVQQGALGVATFASAGLLAAGGAIKLVSAASSAKVALDTLGLTGEKSSGRLGKTASALGKVAVAFGVAEAAGAIFDAKFRKNDATLSDAGQAISSLGSEAGAATPLMDSFFDSTSKKYNDIGPITADIGGLGDALKRVTDPTRGQKVNDFISGWLPGKDQLEVVKGQFDQIDQSLTALGATSAPQAAVGFEAIRKTAEAQGVPLEKLVDLFPQYKAQLQDQATALGVTVPDSAAVYADWMGGKVPDAVLNAAKANPQLAGSADVVAQAQDRASASFATAESALKNLISPQKISADAAQALSTKIFGTAQAALAASDAQIAYAQAVRQAKQSTGGGIDPKTEKGASNLSLLNQQASAYQAVASAQIAAGKSAGSVSAGTQKARDAFIANAEAMGVSSGKAKDLADKYGLIPKNVKVKIEEQVQKDASSELDKLKSLDGSVITPKIQALIDQGKYKQALGAVKDLQKERRAKVKAEADTAGAKGRLDAAAKTRAAKLKAQADGVNDANAKLSKAARKRAAKIVAEAATAAANAALNSAARTRHATIITHAEKGPDRGATGGTITPLGFTGRGPLRFSIGGSVWGAGTATSDSIPAMLANGEEVIRTAQAEKNRSILKQINAGGTWDIVPRFKVGGTIGGFAGGGTVGLTSDPEVLRALVAQQHVDQAQNLKERREADKSLAKAMKKLNDTQSSALESIKQLSTSLQEPYRSDSTDAQDVLAGLTDGAADLKALGAQLAQLKNLGLSQDIINQITSDGAVKGGELAGQIIAGGQGLVNSPNQANADLVKASTALGLTATGVKGHAGGGLVIGSGTGTSDSNLRRLSNREYVVNAEGTARNLGVLDAINYGRAVVAPHAYAAPAASSSASSQAYDQRSWNGGDVVLSGDFGGIDRALRKARSEQRTRLTMARLSVPI